MSVQQKFPILIVGLFLFFAGFASPTEASVDPQASHLTVLGPQAPSTEEPVHLDIGLRSAPGQRPAGPAQGKIYLWAEADGAISPHLKTLVTSLEPGIYMHDTETPGVLILDAAALFKGDRRVAVQIGQAGAYTLKAIYTTQAINPATVKDYWPYTLGGASQATPLHVSPPPSYAVHYLRATPSIQGQTFPSQVSYRGGQPLYPDLTLPLDRAQPTEILVSLSRRNGSSVGPGVPVSAQVQGQGIRLDRSHAVTDAHGQASFVVQGAASSEARLELSVDPDFSVSIPLSAYHEGPQRIRLTIGQDFMDVDGRFISLDSPAVVIDGRTYVPYRSISEALGADVTYDDRIQTITTRFEDTLLTMTIGHQEYARNGQIYPMDAIPYINTDGRTMVPIRFIAEATGYEIQPVYGQDHAISAVHIQRP